MSSGLQEGSPAPDTLDAQAYVRRIDARLASLVPKALPGQASLDAAITDSVLGSGKRLRPLICILTVETFGGDTDAAIDAGCAIEMMHAASLILDDLPCMDDAALRRGRPTAHLRHGEDVAQLSAIAILVAGFAIISDIASLAAERRIEAIRLLGRAVGVEGLVGGQFADLRGGRLGRPVDEIAAANSRKTGSLFEAAVGIGAAISGAPSAARSELAAYASELGHAFQLLDDLLDGAPTAQAVGKDVGKDTGKSTIVSIVGPESTHIRIAHHVDTARRHLNEAVGPNSRLEMLTDQILSGTLGSRE